MPGVCPVVLLTLTVGCFGRSILLPQILCLAWLWTLAARACFFCKSPKKSWLVQWKMTQNFKWKEPHIGDSLPKGPWPKKASHQPRVPSQDYLDHPLWKISMRKWEEGFAESKEWNNKKTPKILKGGTVWIIIVFTPHAIKHRIAAWKWSFSKRKYRHTYIIVFVVMQGWNFLVSLCESYPTNELWQQWKFEYLAIRCSSRNDLTQWFKVIYKPKTSIRTPTHWWFVDVSPFLMRYFQVLCLLQCFGKDWRRNAKEFE